MVSLYLIIVQDLDKSEVAGVQSIWDRVPWIGLGRHLRVLLKPVGLSSWRDGVLSLTAVFHLFCYPQIDYRSSETGKPCSNVHWAQKLPHLSKHDVPFGNNVISYSQFLYIFLHLWISFKICQLLHHQCILLHCFKINVTSWVPERKSTAVPLSLVSS